jgi:fatty acid desaturase
MTITVPSPDPTATAAPPARRRGSAYAQLSRQVRDAGLLDRRTGYYLVRTAVTGALFVGGWTAFALIGASWWQLVMAAFLGVMFTQLGFLGHDAGHKQIFRSGKAAYAFGLLVGNLGIGLSFGWWLDKHNRHHAHPNDLERDPDVGAGALIFDASQAVRRGRLARVVTSMQAYLFLPMILLEGINLHLAGARALRSRALPARWLEGSLLVLHAAAYVTVVSLVLPLGQALAFAAVQQAVFGLTMGLSFAPNHKGMPSERPGDNWDYLRRQVLTSRNVRGGLVVDVLLGGLNYQIEHHLFPSMPSVALRRAQPLVRDYCAAHGVRYVECGLLESYGQALKHLDAVAAQT